MDTRFTVRSPGGAIEVSVITGGQAQQLYRRPRDNAVFTAGAPGQVYKLHVANLDPYGRVEVIATVDGRHTLRDEPGDATRNRGLVFAAGSDGDFSGWRLDNTETRQFVFGSPARSVAAQATGSAAGTGVIGFAAYREALPPRLPNIYSLNADTAYGAAGAPAAMSSSMGAASGATVSRSISFSAGSAPVSELGTGIGERQRDPVKSTSFSRTGTADILVIYYDTVAALDAMGITGWPQEPPAFPGMATGYDRYASA